MKSHVFMGGGSSLNGFDKFGAVGSLEIGRAGNQHIGTVFLANCAGVGIYATVHFDEAVGIDIVHPFFQLGNLGHHVGHELLATRKYSPSVSG